MITIDIKKWRLPAYMDSMLNSYSDVFFIRGKASGILLFIVGLINYNTALSGLFSIIVAYAFAYFIGFNKEYLKSGFYTYNPLLSGLAIGYLFEINILTLSIIAMASILSFLLTVFLANIFYHYLGLQVLSIPFVIISSLVYLASARLSNLYVKGLYTSTIYNDFVFLPGFVNAFFKSMGSIVFMPNVITGVLISGLILFKSRLVLMLAILGFLLGCGINSLFNGSWEQSLNNMNNFNYILIAIAIGCVFNIPSPKSLILAAIGVALSTLLINAVNVFWAQYGIPVFTLPFTLITLSFVYVLGVVGYPLRPTVFRSSPEETLDHYLTAKDRFANTFITLSLPFSGVWSVWQGFNGQWTHQGFWRYAYDFVITDEANNTYKNKGTRLEDYYAFGQPVLSPVRGRVIKVVTHLMDNPIGAVDTINNWGNLIIIHDERGYFVEISHFAKESIIVFEGQWVEPGAHLGSCGNSGYSPQPHIHLQVQATAFMGSETLPFTFVHYRKEDQYHAHGLPDESALVSSVLPTAFHEQLTTFILDETLTYSVYKDGEKIDEVTFVVRMAPDSTFYFSRGDAKLYFGKYAGTFFIYHLEGNDPYLKCIYLALPSVPLTYQRKLCWSDNISNMTFLGYFNGGLSAFLNAFSPSKISTKAHYKFVSETQIEGCVYNDFFKIKNTTKIELDAYLKFKSVKVDNIELKRQSNY
ncbi:urea transporter [Shewanella surugensis]|uniref:Urea transporter n=1 Tax=Shewanella surugensis TaxID=212020 RepID=A0ABT0LDX1_9GAMM|nr:urea transporter [Shewanella surugensis]MCL1125346.1 urea transporter [Shewanella surugensis]